MAVSCPKWEDQPQLGARGESCPYTRPLQQKPALASDTENNTKIPVGTTSFLLNPDPDVAESLPSSSCCAMKCRCGYAGGWF